MNLVGLAAGLMKAAGINIDEKTRHELEVIIPQIPGKAQEVVAAIGVAIQNFDARLSALEKQNSEILELLKQRVIE